MGCIHPALEISGTRIGMIIKCLPDVGIHEEAQNQKNIWYNWSGLYITDQNPEKPILEMQYLDMLKSRNFVGLSIWVSEIDSENFRSIFPRVALLQNNLLMVYREREGVLLLRVY